MYSVLAWLPQEYNFFIKNPEGKLCIWTLNGLLPVAAHLVQSAIDKHGYRDLRGLNITSMPGHIQELTDHLDSLE